MQGKVCRRKKEPTKTDSQVNEEQLDMHSV
jgi:hypothetical protein